MSHELTFSAAIHNPTILQQACASLRKRGKNYAEPRHTTSYYSEIHKKTFTGYEVDLPGWTKVAFFPCDGVTAPMADNWSPYFDNRAVDPVTGLRVNGTGDVHADVLAGRKKVGDDGRWGDIKELHQLFAQYQLSLDEAAAVKTGDQIVNVQYRPDGTINYDVNVAEQAVAYGSY